jgi:Fervidolysin N-terminal prodomain
MRIAALIIFSSLAVLFLAGCTPASTDIVGTTTVPAKPAEQIVPGEVIVQFREGTSWERIEAILINTDTRIKKNLGMPFVYLLSISDASTVEGAIRRLKGFAEVLRAEPNQIMQMENAK